MRPVNLFLTEAGALKLGYYGLATQAECYSIKKTHCDGVRSFGPEVFEGEYEMKSDVWSLGITMIELMGITPYHEYENDDLPTKDGYCFIPFDVDVIESASLTDFLKKYCQTKEERWSVDELMNVSVM